MTSVRIVGPGRAGKSFAYALADAGWKVKAVLGRDDDVRHAAMDVDVLLLAVPDGAVATTAGAIAPVAGTLVAHVSGSLTLEVLAGHARAASVHPLVSMPDEELGAARLWGASFAVAGDDGILQLTEALGGTAFRVADEHRAAYHAAACMASNHLVALLGQVDRVAGSVGLPLRAYLGLVQGTINNVEQVGPAAALTGPVARGDWATVDAHLSALDPAERPAYLALAERARRLADPDAEGTPLPVRVPADASPSPAVKE